MPQFAIVALLVVFGISLLRIWIKVLKEYERGVIFRLGRVLAEPKGPGLIFLFWPLDRMVTIPLRTVVLDVPPQDVITRDNVSVKVNAVLYFRVVDPVRAVVSVENYLYATSQLAQTTLRSVLGQAELDELLSERDRLNERLQEIIDRHTDPWGIKISMVEVKHVDLPQEMQRAMARQAEAEREKRAKFIHAQGELDASKALGEAAESISKNPVTLQLRYLQTLTEIAAENNSTIVFPLPIEMMKAFFPNLNPGSAPVQLPKQDK
ncbi:MAG: slipin family protein [Thermoanaerobaculia bacterium]